jgi:hypothetical protein
MAGLPDRSVCPTQLDVDALLAKHDNEAAGGQCGSQVIAPGNAVREKQHGVIFECDGVIQNVILY